MFRNFTSRRVPALRGLASSQPTLGFRAAATVAFTQQNTNRWPSLWLVAGLGAAYYGLSTQADAQTRDVMPFELKCSIKSYKSSFDPVMKIFQEKKNKAIENPSASSYSGLNLYEDVKVKAEEIMRKLLDHGLLSGGDGIELRTKAEEIMKELDKELDLELLSDDIEPREGLNDENARITKFKKIIVALWLHYDASVRGEEANLSNAILYASKLVLCANESIDFQSFNKSDHELEQKIRFLLCLEFVRSLQTEVRENINKFRSGETTISERIAALDEAKTGFFWLRSSVKDIQRIVELHPELLLTETAERFLDEVSRFNQEVASLSNESAINQETDIEKTQKSGLSL